jgi:FixJ family two-component response regulator
MCQSASTYVAVVDDDDSLCRSLRRLLRTAGFQAVTYHSAEAFLADAKRPDFDCVILDILLPGMSGIELRKQLRTEGWTIPVIFNTAHDEPEIRGRAIESGCAAYLLKTAPGEAILNAIAGAVNRAAEPNSGEAPAITKRQHEPH